MKVQFYPHKEFKEVLRNMTVVDIDAINELPGEEEVAQ